MLSYNSSWRWLAYWATADDGGGETLSLLEILEYEAYTVASFSDMENYWGLYWYYSADI